MREKTRTWHDNFNNVLRDILYPDGRLREQMMVPAKDAGNIRTWLDKYFVLDEMAGEVLSKEQVRVQYYTGEGKSIGEHVRQRYLHFDIYVKRETVYTADPDRLRRRDQLIAQRLHELLTGSTYAANLRFQYEDDFDLATKTIGYRRYHITFSYKTTH